MYKRQGVACADCHMPYQREGAVKYSSHFVASPLKYAEQACGACHTDVSYVVERVAKIQKQVNDTMSRSEDALVAAIQAITDTAKLPAFDAGALDEAVSYTHLRAHETVLDLVCRLLLEKKKTHVLNLSQPTESTEL